MMNVDVESGNEDLGHGNSRVELPNNETALRSLKSSLKEIFFADDPLYQFRNQKVRKKAILGLQYIFPILQWIPNYDLSLFRSDVIAGITIASLAVPQGISYAKLGNLPPVMGLYSSFVPPLIYAVMGSSRDLAIGTTAIVSVLLSTILGKKASPTEEPHLYLQLVLTTTLLTGIFQAVLGIFRLGFIIDFMSHATLMGFMGGVAATISLQQLKGILGLIKFTSNTDVISVLKSVFTNVHNWRWESIVLAICCLLILTPAKILGKKKPKFFFISALAPICTLILATLLVFLIHGDKHGIPILGDLKKGLNTSTVIMITFNSEYLGTVLQASILATVVSLTEGIAIGRSFALLKKYHLDGNKEMTAIGTMNIIGSLTSCYVTTGVLSRTAVNYNAGCKTAMSNAVMSIALMITLFFLTPLFHYTPNVVLSCIILAALVPLVNYQGALHLWKVDKFDFLICIATFLGVCFKSVEIGLALGVGLSVLRVLLNVMRPPVVSVGKIPGTMIYRNTEQYTLANRIPSFLILSIESPVYFVSSVYLQERITRWIRDEEEIQKREFNEKIRFLVLDLTSATSIDSSGVNALVEIKRTLDILNIQLVLANPNTQVMARLNASKFIGEVLGEKWLFLTVEEAVLISKTQEPDNMADEIYQ